MKARVDMSYEIVKYGSTVNGLATSQSSDLDLTFCIADTDMPHNRVLGDIKTVLEKHQEPQNRYKFQAGMPRADKSGWILRFEDTFHHIDIDIMVNKTSEVLNSMLVLEYARLDERFHKLALFLKRWSKLTTNDTFKRVNNFSIYLMLIALMQSEKCLPNLQALASTGDQR